MATQNIAYGTWTSMTVTNLQSLANDATDPFSGWQSARVDNRTTLAMDYEIDIALTTAASAPSGVAAAFVYIVPWMHDGTNWTPGANFATTTRPTGTEGTASISEPNSMPIAIQINYKVTSQPLDGFFTIAQLFGGIVPDGWSIAIRNSTGAALSTGCVVAYRPITFTVA